MLSALGLQAKPHESDAVFGMLDDDGSRVLDFKELQKALRLAKQTAALDEAQGPRSRSELGRRPSSAGARGEESRILHEERARRPSKLTVEVGEGRGSPAAEQSSKPPPKPPSRLPPKPPPKPNERLRDAGQAAVAMVSVIRVPANQSAARGRAARPIT